MDQSLLVCAYRSLSVETHECAIALLSRPGWKECVRHGDALISRARSLVASQWWCQTKDDVFVMVDSDIIFTPDGIEQLVQHCRDGLDIVVAGYPSRNGQFLTSQALDPVMSDAPLIELRYAASGCMAVHRRVLDSLIPNMPLCHPKSPVAFWPLFMPMVAMDEDDLPVYLSEDYAFTRRARIDAGMHAWMDPHVRISHIGEVQLSIDNMQAFHEAVGQKW